jgi:hypothetical protein
MSKQTAVEWFAEKVEQHLLTFGSIQPSVLSKFKQEAKAMEKEQIVDACNSQRNDYRGMPTYNKSGEQYYNSTYKGGDK